MEVLKTNPDNIKVEGRTRKEFTGIEELAQSIIEHGLIHPIRVTAELVLIAGERRLRACKLAGVEVDYIVKEKCSEAELKELELRENLDRADMTWTERVAGLAELDKMKKKEFGQAKAGQSSAGWSMKDTAELVGGSTSEVHRAVSMNKMIQLMPELASCTSMHEAEKKLGKMTEKLAIAELLRRKKDSGEAVVSNTADRDFIVGDAFLGLRSRESESVDFINCDTPYGIDLKDVKKIVTDTRTDEDYKEWSRDSYIPSIVAVASECYRILRNDRWLVFWYGQEWYLEVREVLLAAGFKLDKIPACWYGGTGAAQTIAVEQNLGRCYEQFFICRKGDPILLKRGRPNVFAFDKTPAQKKIHPTEKPVELMKEIYSTFVMPGHQACSPFIGSGNDGRAAYEYGLDWFGWDLNQDVKNKFLLRVEDDIKTGLYGKSTNS